MSENKIGRKIRLTLEESLDLQPEVEVRLSQSRALAIEAHAEKWKMGISRQGLSQLAIFSLFRDLAFPRLLLPTIALIAGLMTIQSLQQAQTAEEIEEIDTAVLTGDLPLDAYTDAGFDAWLRRSTR